MKILLKIYVIFIISNRSIFLRLAQLFLVVNSYWLSWGSILQILETSEMFAISIK